MGNQEVVILIIAHKSHLSFYEEVSLRQCFKVLGNYPIRFICPKGLDITNYLKIIPDLEVDFIDPAWQSSYRNFNRLKIEPFLYRRYQLFEYILYYELDAFVFRDELKDWCKKGLDFIGAPWIEQRNGQLEIVGVGNGGFSLRKVESHLKALHSFSYIFRPSKIVKKHRERNYSLIGFLSFMPSILKELTGVSNNSFYLFNKFKYNEDYFWGHHINKNFSWFRVANTKTALRFSFEKEPDYLYKINKEQLPFGCHAWYRYDLQFWKPFIEKEGYCLEAASSEE